MRTATAGSGPAGTRFKGVTFADLVRERLHLGSPRNIGNALWEEFGASIFELLPQLAPSLLAEQARHVVASSARKSVATPVLVPLARLRGRTEMVASNRVARMHKTYWSEQWRCEEVWKATRDLTVNDLRWLIANRTAEAEKNRSWAVRFETWLNQARQHGVKILGDLEKKGVDLIGAAAIAGAHE